MSVRLSAGVVCAVLVGLLAPAAGAATKGLSHVPQIDVIGQQLAGYSDIEVDGEDDPYAWGQLLGALGDVSPAEQTLGFVTIYALPGFPTYHRIYVSPAQWPALVQAINGDWSNPAGEAIAVFDLTHEALHYRLFSSDEGLVNACALKIFPTVLSTYFGVQPTVNEPTQVEHDRPLFRTVKRVSYVRVHGKRVRHVRLSRVSAGTAVTYTDDGPPVTVPNPTYSALVFDAQTFYASQPPPYSTGSCP
jgi:hypothetical protein